MWLETSSEEGDILWQERGGEWLSEKGWEGWVGGWVGGGVTMYTVEEEEEEAAATLLWSRRSAPTSSDQQQAQ